MATGTVRIRGLRELQRDLKRANGDIAKDLRKELKAVAEPVRARAAEKAVAEISHIGPKWSRMRVGATGKTVYVAPASRRSGGAPRANLGPLLMNRALQPALDEMQGEILEKVELMLDVFGVSHGF